MTNTKKSNGFSNLKITFSFLKISFRCSPGLVVFHLIHTIINVTALIAMIISYKYVFLFCFRYRPHDTPQGLFTSVLPESACEL